MIRFRFRWKERGANSCWWSLGGGTGASISDPSLFHNHTFIQSGDEAQSCGTFHDCPFLTECIHSHFDHLCIAVESSQSILIDGLDD